MKTTTKDTRLEDRTEARVKEELTAIDTETLYRSMLDEVYSFASVGGPFESMSPARVLEEVDPVAYRCGKNDWEDGESRGQWEEIDGDYYDRSEVEAIREEVQAEIDEEDEEEDQEPDDDDPAGGDEEPGSDRD